MDPNLVAARRALADWLVTRVDLLVGDTLAQLGANRAEGDWLLEAGDAIYPALGPAAALAWTGAAGDEEHDRRLAIITAERFIDAAPVLRVPRPVIRAAPRLPTWMRPAWSASQAISAGPLLGWIILGLEPHLDDARRRRMIKTLVRCYDEVARATHFNVYINGNYQIPLCELAYFHGLFTGSEAASEAYERCVGFLCTPERTDPRWRGWGLRLTQEPTRSDWHDAVGHFSEVEERRPDPERTFDGEYTQLQLDHVIRLWLLNGDGRMLHFANALFNAILPYADRTTWQCDFRDGSRRDQIVPFFNAGLATLFLHDPRPELTEALVRAQVTTAIDAEWRYRTRIADIDNYKLRGYGLTHLSLLIAGSPERHLRVREAGA